MIYVCRAVHIQKEAFLNPTLKLYPCWMKNAAIKESYFLPAAGDLIKQSDMTDVS